MDTIYSATSMIRELIDLLRPKNAEKRNAVLNARKKYLNKLRSELDQFTENLRKSIGAHESDDGQNDSILYCSPIKDPSGPLINEHEFHELKNELSHLRTQCNNPKVDHLSKQVLLNQFIKKHKINQIAQPVQQRCHLTSYIKSQPVDELDTAREELYDAIESSDDYSQTKILHQLAFPAQSHDDPTSGKVCDKLCFDDLVEKFNRYNTAAKKLGQLNLDEERHQREYLHRYFAKNCYEETSTLFKFISFALFYPIGVVFVYREIKRAIAKTETFYSPSAEYQIQMEYANDNALFFQPISWLRHKYFEVTPVKSIDRDDLHIKTERLLKKLQDDKQQYSNQGQNQVDNDFSYVDGSRDVHLNDVNKTSIKTDVEAKTNIISNNYSLILTQLKSSKKTDKTNPQNTAVLQKALIHSDENYNIREIHKADRWAIPVPIVSERGFVHDWHCNSPNFS